MPRSQFLGSIGSVQQEVYSFFVIFFLVLCLCDIADLLHKIAYAACGD